MKILLSLRKRANSPCFIGFFCASCLYFLFTLLLIYNSSTQQILLKQEGHHSFTLTLYSFQEQQSANTSHKQLKDQEKSKINTPKPSSTHKKQTQSIQKTSKEQLKKSSMANIQSIQEVQKEVQEIQENVQETLKHNEGITHEFLSKIHSLISSYNPYPQMARRQRLEGEVVVEFILDTSGVMSGVKIVRTNTKEILQKSALKALYLASKHFPLPKKRVKIQVPILYRLN